MCPKTRCHFGGGNGDSRGSAVAQCIWVNPEGFSVTLEVSLRQPKRGLLSQKVRCMCAWRMLTRPTIRVSLWGLIARHGAPDGRPSTGGPGYPQGFSQNGGIQGNRRRRRWQGLRSWPPKRCWSQGGTKKGVYTGKTVGCFDRGAKMDLPGGGPKPWLNLLASEYLPNGVAIGELVSGQEICAKNCPQGDPGAMNALDRGAGQARHPTK